MRDAETYLLFSNEGKDTVSTVVYEAVVYENLQLFLPCVHK